MGSGRRGRPNLNVQWLVYSPGFAVEMAALSCDFNRSTQHIG